MTALGRTVTIPPRPLKSRPGVESTAEDAHLDDRPVVPGHRGRVGQDAPTQQCRQDPGHVPTVGRRTDEDVVDGPRSADRFGRDPLRDDVIGQLGCSDRLHGRQVPSQLACGGAGIDGDHQSAGLVSAGRGKRARERRHLGADPSQCAVRPDLGDHQQDAHQISFRSTKKSTS